MLLVHGLSCHAKRLRDLWPGPAFPHRALHQGVFQLIRQAAKGHHARESIGLFITFGSTIFSSIKQL